MELGRPLIVVLIVMATLLVVALVWRVLRVVRTHGMHLTRQNEELATLREFAELGLLVHRDLSATGEVPYVRRSRRVIDMARHRVTRRKRHLRLVSGEPAGVTALTTLGRGYHRRPTIALVVGLTVLVAVGISAAVGDPNPRPGTPYPRTGTGTDLPAAAEPTEPESSDDDVVQPAGGLPVTIKNAAGTDATRQKDRHRTTPSGPPDDETDDGEDSSDGTSPSSDTQPASPRDDLPDQSPPTQPPANDSPPAAEPNDPPPSTKQPPPGGGRDDLPPPSEEPSPDEDDPPPTTSAASRCALPLVLDPLLRSCVLPLSLL